MRLRTPRLVLREITPGDADAVLAYRRDPRYLRYYGAPPPAPADAAAFVGRCVAWKHERPRWRAQLAVELPGAGMIGNAGLRRDAPGEPVADLGYELAPEHWGNGYATEAAAALLDHGFGAWRLERVHAHCIAENAASARVLERIGMREEGRLRAHRWFDGRGWDVLLFGILRAEWTPRAPAPR